MSKKIEVKLPMHSVRADFAPGSINAEKRTIELVWATGAKGLRNGWDGRFYEELSMDPAHVDMGRLQSGNAPLLDAHDAYSNASVIGVVESARLEGIQGIATVRFADTPDVANIWRKIETGILKNVSVGYTVEKFERQPQKDGDPIPHLLATRWTPKEISIVPMGFDPNASVRSDGGALTLCEVIETKSPSEKENETRGIEKMSEETKPKELETPVAVAPVLDEKLIAETAVKTERARQIEIREISTKLALGQDFETRMINEGVELSKVRELAIEKKAEAQLEIKTTRIEAGNQDEKQTLRDGVENALLHRVDRSVALEKGKDFVGMSLMRISEEFLGSIRGISKSEIATRALSSSDFPHVLANVASKTLRKAYDAQPKTFMPFVSMGTLPDYKAMKRIQFGDAPSLISQAEGGELTYGSVGEGSESISLVKYAKGLLVTEETIINDDLQAFSRLPALFGAAAARLESKLVYDLLLANAAMSDGVALFHADHGNLPSAAAIQEAGVTAAKILMREQKTLDGLDYLNLTPAFIVCGSAKEVEALKLMNQIVASQTSNVNVFANSMQVIVDPRVTGNKWFLMASPSQIDTIEVAYLEGMSGPEITSEKDFDTSGLKLKCKHVVGVKAIDYRGMVYNSGA